MLFVLYACLVLPTSQEIRFACRWFGFSTFFVNRVVPNCYEATNLDRPEIFLDGYH